MENAPPSTTKLLNYGFITFLVTFLTLIFLYLWLF
jgi:hypothetical protein